MLSREEEADKITSDFRKKHVVELIYFPLLVFLFFISRYKIQQYFNDDVLSEKVLSITGVFMFGTIHVLASNMLSILYDLDRFLAPVAVAPRVTPRRLKIFGAIVMLAALTGGIIIYPK